MAKEKLTPETTDEIQATDAMEFKLKIASLLRHVHKPL